MREAQTVKYDDNGHITKIVQGVGKDSVNKKPKYIQQLDDEERTKKDKRSKRKQKE